MGNLNPCTNLKSVSIIKNLGNDLPITRVNIVRLVLIGLDNSGKTSTALHLLKKPINEVVPTLGFNSYELNSSIFNQKKNTKIELIDLGGSSKIRSLWEEYYSSAHGFIFLLDSSDSKRLEEIKTELEKLLCNQNVKGKPLLVLLNKMDLDNALDEIEICGEIKIEKLANEYKCPTKIEQCSVIDNLYDQKMKKNFNTGIENGFIWLINYISNNWEILNQRVEKEVELKDKELNEKIDYLKEKFKNKVSEKTDQVLTEEKLKENPFKPIKELVNGLEKKYSINDKNMSKDVKKLEEEKILKDDKVPYDEESLKIKNVVKDEKKLDQIEKFNVKTSIDIKNEKNVKKNKFQEKVLKVKSKILSINELNKLKNNEKINDEEKSNNEYSKIEKEISFSSNSTDTLSNETVIEVKKN